MRDTISEGNVPTGERHPDDIVAVASKARTATVEPGIALDRTRRSRRR